MIPGYLRQFAAIASVVLLLSGCMGRFNYKVPQDAPVADKTYDCTVRVDPFNDDRPRIGGTGPMWLYTVPGVIYGYGFYNRPEDGHFYLGIAGFKFKPKDQLAQAAQKSIKHADIFKKAYMKNHNWEEPDLVFTGNIKSTKFKERMYSYGLSVFGPLLWLLGAPAGWTDNQLKIQFILKYPGSEKVIWKYTGNDSVSSVHWFYYQGQDVKGYVPAMQHIMANAIENLQGSLKHKSMWSICQGRSSQATNTGSSQHNSWQSASATAALRKAEDYHHGALGVNKDLAKAAKWYLVAARKGNTRAQTAIGSMYYYGRGVNKDYAKARKWLTKAAWKGNADAQYLLAWAYMAGPDITRRDAKQAYIWLKISQHFGPERNQQEVRMLLDAAKSRMHEVPERAVAKRVAAIEK